MLPFVALKSNSTQFGASQVPSGRPGSLVLGFLISCVKLAFLWVQVGVGAVLLFIKSYLPFYLHLLEAKALQVFYFDYP